MATSSPSSSPLPPSTDSDDRDSYQQISMWLNEFVHLTPSTDIEYVIRSSSTTLSSVLTISGGTDGSYTRSYPYDRSNRISVPSATISQIPSTIIDNNENVNASVYRSGYLQLLNMLWLSVDQKLYLWKYPTMIDLIELKFDSIIFSCDCVKRQKQTTLNDTSLLSTSSSYASSFFTSWFSSSNSNIPPTLTTNDLIEHHTYLLIVLTGQDIVLYTIDQQQQQQPQWFTTPTIKYSLQQIGYFDCLASTFSGRFFLGGQYGDIHEFIYNDTLTNNKCSITKLGQTFLSNLLPTFLQSGLKSSAQSSSVKQITIDYGRLLLYARLANDTLHIYDISNEKGQRLFAYTFDDLIMKLKQRQTISIDDYKPFLTMYTVQLYESNLFNLILVTHTGIRLYYTFITANNQPIPTTAASTTGTSASATQQQQQQQQPARLELIHVRYAPTIPNLQTQLHQPLFRTAYVDLKCLFLFTTDMYRPQTYGRMILLINSDTTLLTSSTLLSRNFGDNTMNQQQTQASNENQSQLFNELFLIQDQISLFILNILELNNNPYSSTSYLSLPRIGPLAINQRYMIQTYDSIITFEIPKTIEHLRLLLFYDGQIHSDIIKQFFQHYSLRYSCSMSVALTLTYSNTNQSENFLYNGSTNNSLYLRINDDRIRELAFQTFLWYSSSTYMQYLETLLLTSSQQQQTPFNLDNSRYPNQQQSCNARSTMMPPTYLRQHGYFERYIIPLRINSILFVLSDILRPIWLQPLIELKTLTSTKSDKKFYYLFHKVDHYNDIKQLLKQLQYFLKKLAPHMCCTWSANDIPQYNEQLAQRAHYQQQQQQQQQQYQNQPLFHTSPPNIMDQTNFQRASIMTPRNSNVFNTSLFGSQGASTRSPQFGMSQTSSIAHNNSSMQNLTTPSLFPSSIQTSAPTAAVTTNQLLLSTTSLSSMNDLLHEIDYYTTICNLVERLLELLSLWQIINENRTDMIIDRLPEQYLQLISNNPSSFTIHTLLELDIIFFDNLIAALLISFEQNEAGFDQLVGRLLDECPKLFPVEKLILYKVDIFLKPSTTADSTSGGGLIDKQQRLKQACHLYKQICDRINITPFCMTLYTFHMYDDLIDLCITSGKKRDPCNQALTYYYNQLNENDQQQQLIDLYHRRTECYLAILNILELLYERDYLNTKNDMTNINYNQQSQPQTINQAPSFNEFLQLCLSFDDEFLHVKIFDWLMSKQLNDKIKLHRTTPYIERFIRYRLKLTNYSDYLTLDVAIIILQTVKDHTTLCQVLIHLVDLNDSHVTLSDRLYYLAESLQIARSAQATITPSTSNVLPSLLIPQKRSHQQENHQTLNELIPNIEQRLQTAFIQKQIYSDLQTYLNILENNHGNATNDQQQQVPIVTDALQKLDMKLYDATELFVDYAQKFELYECQLLLLQLDGNEEQTILYTIWKRLLRKELNDVLVLINHSYYDKMLLFQQHLIERLKTCRKKRLRVPIDFLINELEQILYQQNNDDDGDQTSIPYDWIVNLLLQSGFTQSELLTSYDQSYRQTSTSTQKRQLLRGICALLLTFDKNPANLDHTKQYSYNRPSSMLLNNTTFASSPANMNGYNTSVTSSSPYQSGNMAVASLFFDKYMKEIMNLNDPELINYYDQLKRVKTNCDRAMDKEQTAFGLI
ncbi:unnamed protein product [Didymodactylos carnosus]|uniref:Uncharacterized protein n=1 Tax=Didymodactylos carnosus TaxID=1234261 RepID=A0A813SPG9_9BILA|nr:unnamed protein product [Didymodactylos carnosus]CAF0817547.1 unnamed protein product [Didymodactylos carnosus]CAF3588005.1 unnamed protein product [Didymodactylos carnosus]CAF3601634.1 unnamed protein product [Didymodactylos carnosus]